MKVNDGFILRNIADSWLVVPIGERVVDFNGMIALNETGAFLWELLAQEQSLTDLVQKLQEEFAVDEATARLDTTDFIDLLQEGGLLE